MRPQRLSAVSGSGIQLGNSDGASTHNCTTWDVSDLIVFT